MPSADEPKPKRKTASKPKPATSPTQSRKQRTGSSYDAYRESQAEISRERSKAGRDIAENFPVIVDAARRNGGMDDLRLFAETYFPERFAMAWSDVPPPQLQRNTLQYYWRALAECGCAAPSS